MDNTVTLLRSLFINAIDNPNNPSVDGSAGPGTDPDPNGTLGEDDEACTNAGEGTRCDPGFPRGNTYYGICCHGIEGGPDYLYCQFRMGYGFYWKKAYCDYGQECVTVEKDWITCGDTS